MLLIYLISETVVGQTYKPNKYASVKIEYVEKHYTENRCKIFRSPSTSANIRQFLAVKSTVTPDTVRNVNRLTQLLRVLATYLHTSYFLIVEEFVRAFLESKFHVVVFRFVQKLRVIRRLVQPCGSPRQLISIVS
jgi:hypothetical protein